MWAKLEKKKTRSGGKSNPRVGPKWTEEFCAESPAVWQSHRSVPQLAVVPWCTANGPTHTWSCPRLPKLAAVNYSGGRLAPIRGWPAPPQDCSESVGCYQAALWDTVTGKRLLEALPSGFWNSVCVSVCVQCKCIFIDIYTVYANFFLCTMILKKEQWERDLVPLWFGWLSVCFKIMWKNRFPSKVSSEGWMNGGLGNEFIVNIHILLTSSSRGAEKLNGLFRCLYFTWGVLFALHVEMCPSYSA